MRYKVMLVDDRPEFIQLAKDILSSHPAINVVGEALSGEDALEAFDDLNPEVVVIDVNMPGMNGIQVARHLVEKQPDVYVVMTSAVDNPGYHDLANAVGAVGFISKKKFCGDSLLEIIRSYREIG